VVAAQRPAIGMRTADQFGEFPLAQTIADPSRRFISAVLKRPIPL
jgi:hypothetical protein